MNNTTELVYQMEGTLDSKITLAVYVVTLVVGTIANILVLTVLFTKKTRKTDQDIMVINLCFADWFLIMVKFPLKLDGNFRYIYWSNVVCKFIDILPTVCHFAAIYIVALMAVNRCRVLIHPLTTQMRLSVAVACCIVVWFMAFLVVSPLMLLRVSYNYKFCGSIPLTEYQAYLYQIYRRVYVPLVFPVPLLIITASYIRLGVHLYRARVPRVASVQGSIRMDARRKENLDVIKTLAVIVLLFTVFMLPIFIARVKYELMTPKERMVMSMEYKNFLVYSRLIAISHSCINPIIYGSLTKNVRQKYKAWLYRCWGRTRAQETSSAGLSRQTPTKSTRKFKSAKVGVAINETML